MITVISKRNSPRSIVYSILRNCSPKSKLPTYYILPSPSSSADRTSGHYPFGTSSLSGYPTQHAEHLLRSAAAPPLLDIIQPAHLLP